MLRRLALAGLGCLSLLVSASGSAAALSQSHAWSPDRLIPRAGSMSDTRTIADAGSDFTITELSVTVGITHAPIGDLTLSLAGPAGTVVELMDKPGDADQALDGIADEYDIDLGDDIASGTTAQMLADQRVTFDDAAGSTVGQHVTATNAGTGDTISGTFRPSGESGLGSFAGRSLDGPWTLIAQDAGDPAAPASNSLDYWRIEASGDPGNAAPSPSAISVSLTLAAGFMLLRPRRTSSGASSPRRGASPAR
jgi:hypothetical protein